MGVPLRIKFWAGIDTIGIVFRVWMLCLRTGIPFTPLLNAHLKALDLYREKLEQLVNELKEEKS